ncbi:MAG: 4Fe-4S dicluster domain-containing protein [Phycisphaerales bacterium]|nr:4Fe-4S dicluster domain-containing protein [Phycisphaerales bacterium]
MIPADAARQIAKDLAGSAGRCVIAAGARQSAEMHALAAALNQALGNVGKTVRYFAQSERPDHAAAITAAAESLRSADTQAVLILGGNPAYDAPADTKFAEALAASSAQTIHLSLEFNDTSQRCKWHVNRAHFLECWGDVRGFDGTASIQQPLIAPLYDGKSPIELLLWLLGDEKQSGYDAVRETHQTAFSGTDLNWEVALRDGVIANSAWAAADVGRVRLEWVAALAQQAAGAGATTGDVLFALDHKVYDGRFANNGWLQELPDPLTKITWDNAALLSYDDAKRLGMTKNGDRVRIECNGTVVELPGYILPGHASGSVTVTLGYGRSQVGAIARGVGFSVAALRSTSGWLAAHGNVTRGSGSHTLATTQDHHAIDTKLTREREQEVIPLLVREGDLTDFAAHPDFAQHVAHVFHLPQLFPEPTPYDGYKWGMSIDLNACTGCSTCVVACQAENNIPVVGKAEVLRGREMHWLRIDRYFRGQPQDADVKVAFQPMPCQHCENAPCEQVCPVAATVHDTEGLNLMVYNRCVGTRYCANNCPYKVRRFNWFYNHNGPRHPRSRQELTAIQKMGMNPDVTVRSRGVMEKCSFCIQRISQAKITAANEVAKRVTAGEIPAVPAGVAPIADGLLLTACQQACPTQAITFGNLNDHAAQVAKNAADPRSYTILEELNARPRTRYMARLRNTGHSLLKGHNGHDHGPADGHGAPAKHEQPAHS